MLWCRVERFLIVDNAFKCAVHDQAFPVAAAGIWKSLPK